MASISSRKEIVNQTAYDDWGWLYFGPLLAFQAVLLASVWRSRTIRFQQLMLSLCGLYWSIVVYYVQYYPKGSRTLFCDISISRCSACLHDSISYLPEFAGLVERGSPMNRSIADTSLLYYMLHVVYPFTQRLAMIGHWMTHVGFFVSVIVACCCVFLLHQQLTLLGDICIVNLLLYIINILLARAMGYHLRNALAAKRDADTGKDD